jgi:phosphoribosylformimino-5-aminoimidazole carboxamide ribotide isomerase
LIEGIIASTASNTHPRPIRRVTPPKFHPIVSRSPIPHVACRTLSMLLIPAIDLKDGRCVRLRQGDMNNATVFSDDPVAMARHWVEQGARRLHIVDLNGARSGKPVNACSAFGGHVIVALDAKGGKVATDGWSKLTGHDVVDLAKKFEDYGVDAILYTDIGRDGMLSGVNIEATVELARAVRIPVIASGGIADLSDIERLCAVQDDGIEAAILGRSLYEGTLNFKDAQERADALTSES